MTTTLPTDAHLAGLRFAGMSGLAALVGRLGASVWWEGRWLDGDRSDSPAVLVGGGALPVLDPSRRSLVVLPAGERVECMEAADPLVVAGEVHARGAGQFSGMSFLLREPGRAPSGDPLAFVRAVPVVSVSGSCVVVVDEMFLSDASIAAADNARLVVFALTGKVDEELVDAVHSHVAASRPHRRPPSLDLSAASWGFLDVPPPGEDLSGPGFSRAVRRNVRCLPEEAFDALLEFADEGNDAGALLLRGLPVGDLPPTPPTPTSAFVKDLRSELTLLTVGRLLGQPVGYLPENNGNVVQNIVPTREGANRQVSTSSAVNLAWHTEAAFHPHRPRFLLLFCLRGDPSARTTLCSIREIVAGLPLRTRAVLASPRFRTRADESYVASASRPQGRLVSVLGGNPLRPTLVFDADLMSARDEEGRTALTELAAAMERSHTSVVLAPGDLLVVDNSVAVHGRSPFVPRFDGTDRWLQRTFVVSDLAASAGERSGRVIRTRFSSSS